MSDEIHGQLHPKGILGFMSEEDIALLSNFGNYHSLPAGTVLLEYGVEQDSLYIVCSGALEVSYPTETGDVTLGVVEPCDCVGEVSVFEPGLTSAKVVVSQPAIVWQLSISQIRDLQQQQPLLFPQLILGLVQLLSRRLRQADKDIVVAKLLPVHLSVRSMEMAQPPDEPEEESGLFGMMKKTEYKLPTRIKI